MTDQTNRAEWLAERRSGIGASEMPVLLGESEWDSVITLWQSKRGELDDEREDSELMELGRELETAILNVVAKRAGVTVAKRGTLERSKSIRWAVATPDGMTADGEPIEVKNLSFGFDEEGWEEQIPEKYRIQCNHQMLVTGAKRALFGTLVWGRKVVWEWIERDEALIRRIIRAGDRFWECVESGEMPSSDGHPKARKALGKLANDTNDIELFREQLDDHLFSRARADARLSELRAEIRKLEKTRDAATDEVAKLMLGHRSAYTADGWRFEWRDSERKGFTVAPKKIRQFKIIPPKEAK